MMYLIDCACCRDDARKERMGENEGEAANVVADPPPEIRGLPVLPAAAGGGHEMISPRSETSTGSYPAQQGFGQAAAVTPEPNPKAAPKGSGESDAGSDIAGSDRAAAKALAKKEKKAKARLDADQLAKQGDEAFARGDQDDAIAYYTQAIGLNKKNVAAWAGRGGVRYRKNMLQESLDDLDEALRLSPGHLLCLRDRAHVKLQLGDNLGAIEDFNAKIQLAPADGKALYGRGEAKLANNDRAGAIQDFELAGKLGLPGARERARKEKAKS